jgi:hypothetical protein
MNGNEDVRKTQSRGLSPPLTLPYNRGLSPVGPILQPGGQDAFSILANENYVDKFDIDTASYDDTTGFIHLEYKKLGKSLQVHVHVISPATTDPASEEAAIKNYKVDNGIWMPLILNPHTVPRLARYAQKIRVWQQEVDNAFALAKVHLAAAIAIGSFAGGGLGPAPEIAVISLPLRRFAARTAFRFQVEAAMAGKVAYGATDLSRLSMAARVQAGELKGNFAAVEFKNAAGQLEKRVAQSTGGGGKHAEEILKNDLAAAKVDPKDVTRWYSEYEPCITRVAGTPCAVIMQKLFPNAIVTYSFEYGATLASRAAGRNMLTEAIEALIRFFKAGGVP